MNILVACEYSGRVRDAFIAKGHHAVSCDILPTESSYGSTHTHQHIQGDVRELLTTAAIRRYKWDMLLAYPDCTFLCSSGVHWCFHRPKKPKPGNLYGDERRRAMDAAAEFFLLMANAEIKYIAVENPVGVMSKRFRKPDQTIQPNMFGEDASKATCLWLKNLPLLQPTLIVPGKYHCPCGGPRFPEELEKYGCPNCNGDSGPAKLVWGNQTGSGQNRLGPSEDRGKIRAKTYQGVAEAKARQWGVL